ncbi:MAG: hypothetical protein AAGD07_02575 [Planctomycetota bacterium]
MSVAVGANDPTGVASDPIVHAVSLLNQQVWCWGRDILRPEGNWLVEVGFESRQPPPNRQACSRVYTLTLPGGRCVVLRGFGVFYGNRDHGGVFLPRFEFRPRYTPCAVLEDPPWSNDDLPRFNRPTALQRNACVTLTLDLIDWIRGYEVNVCEQLGIAYRQSVLAQWDSDKNSITPAESFPSAWRELSIQVAANFDAYSPWSVS